MDVAVGACVGTAAVCRDVSEVREAAVVALMGMMATVLMGGERASVVVANLRAFRDVRFEWDPSALWADPGVSCTMLYSWRCCDLRCGTGVVNGGGGGGG